MIGNGVLPKKAEVIVLVWIVKVEWIVASVTQDRRADGIAQG